MSLRQCFEPTTTVLVALIFLMEGCSPKVTASQLKNDDTLYRQYLHRPIEIHMLDSMVVKGHLEAMRGDSIVVSVRKDVTLATSEIAFLKKEPDRTGVTVLLVTGAAIFLILGMFAGDFIRFSP